MEGLRELLNRFQQLPNDVFQDILSRIQQKVFERNEHILRAGQISRHICYFADGLVRTYEGDEETGTTTWLLGKNDIAFGMESFIHQIPCTQSMQTIKRTELYYMPREDFYELKSKYPAFEALQNSIMQYYYEVSRFNKDLGLGKSSTEHYIAFCEKYPGIAADTPDKYMASYLGISKSTFCRIKRNLARGIVK